MSNSVSVIAAGLTAIVALAAAPVLAQPLQITVTDPGLIVEEQPGQPPPGRYERPSKLFDYHLNFNTNFDPGEAAMDSQFVNRPGPAIHTVRAAVLDRNNESLAEHQLRCQAMYATYEPVSDTYLGSDGIPQYCVY